MLPSELAARLAVAAGLRNVLAHEYAAIDLGLSQPQCPCQVGLSRLCHAGRLVHQLVERLIGRLLQRSKPANALSRRCMI